MTAITEVAKYTSLLPAGLKIVVIDASGTTGNTYDTYLDATNGVGAEFKEIYDAYQVLDTGGRTDATYVASTGIITIANMGTATDFKLIIIGR